jgi:uncharacterized protein with ParB-like and HNH nuclease domain
VIHTEAKAPQKIFILPQQFLVPLFQRRYRWGEEKQWDPLWRDVQRVADRLLNSSGVKVNPHFLGAVVLQQVENPTGSLSEKTIIDGQQRFTTLQLLMDAVQGELEKVGATVAATNLSALIENSAPYRGADEEQFKIRPTHEDRPQFDGVMAAEHPIDYQKLKKKLTPEDTKGTAEFRMIDAHEFFAAKCREWLIAEDEEKTQKRAEILDKTLREYLEIVVIDLAVDDNSQEIFETLNSRGVELTAADLIKNFVFQRLRADHSESNIESFYNEYWRDFDRLAFWDEEESLGRIKQKRSSAFLGYWLTSQTGEETVLSEVFQRFKNLVLHDLDIPILELLARIKKSAATYNKLVDASMREEGGLTRPELFMYRIKALDSNLAKSIVLTLLDEQRQLTEVQINGVLDAVESWIVRRAILQKSTKRYNYIFADIVRTIRTSKSDTVVEAVTKFLSSETSDTSYWPDDDDVRTELRTRNMYHRRPRGRMILEAIEDHYRGWGNTGPSKSETPRALRMVYSVEHLIPQGWEKNWPLPEGVTPQMRSKGVHLLGNLTLVTKSLNSSLSNDKWQKKKETLSDRDIGFMNKKIISEHPNNWGEVDVEKRLTEIEKVILQLWPVPEGHKVDVGAARSAKTKREVLLTHLLEDGYVKVGQLLYPKPGKYSGRNALVLEDGSIELEGQLFNTPSGAGRFLRGKATAGWHFWLVNPESKQMLWDVRQQYIEALSTDVEIEDDDEDDEDDDSN